MQEIGQDLDVYTFDYILEQALSNVSDSLDKRQGSVIYDAIAPACYELAEFYQNLKIVLERAFISTSSGDYLDYKAEEQGLTRLQATESEVNVYFLDTNNAYITNVTIGNRFSRSDDSVTFTVIEKIDTNNYRAVCDSSGTIGNLGLPSSEFYPIDNIQNLKTITVTETLVAARDVETDEELRARFLLTVNKASFGGNVSQYVELLKSYEGIGAVQVYPVWNGGGTVKLSLLDTEFNPVSNEYLEELKEIIDPTTYTGLGNGLAPIGHSVTIGTATEIEIDIECNITLVAGYNIGMVQSAVESALANYFETLKASWDTLNLSNTYTLNLYVAKINSIILGVSGVENVTDTTLNGSGADIYMTQSAGTQQIPALGTVNLID